MSIEEAVRRAITNLATSGLAYRSGTSGPFVAFSGDAVLHADRPDMLGFDDDAKSEEAMTTATLKARDDATALSFGYQLQQTVTIGGVAKTRTFAVMGMSHHRGKVVYRLKRTVPTGDAGPNRGKAR